MNGIRFEGKEWLFKGDAEGIIVTLSTGPMGIPVSSFRIPPEIHLTFCKLLKVAARESQANGWKPAKGALTDE
jgi:hypothetical protein